MERLLGQGPGHYTKRRGLELLQKAGPGYRRNVGAVLEWVCPRPLFARDNSATCVRAVLGGLFAYLSA